MRVVFTGTRSDEDADGYEGILASLLTAWHEAWPDDLTVGVGDCPTGIDKIVRNMFHDSTTGEIDERCIVFHADWDTQGLKAGPIRNRAMIDAAPVDLVIACHPNLKNSKGTKDCVTYARSQGIAVYLISKVE